MNNRAVDSDAKFDTTKIEDRSLTNRIVLTPYNSDFVIITSVFFSPIYVIAE